MIDIRLVCFNNFYYCRYGSSDKNIALKASML